MTALPPSTDFTSAANQGAAKAFMTSARAFLSGLLGADGTVATARATLGAASSGANSDITSLTGLTEPWAFRNRVINGNFGINQRGVSGTVTLAAGAYGHDRWKAGSGGCTYTFATVENVTTLTLTAGTLQQVIEGANLLSGAHKLSWAGTAQGRIDSGAYGASGVAGTVVGGTNQTVEFGTGSLSAVQYEPGAVTTIFEQRPIGLELVLCQRYYQTVMPITGLSSTSYNFITCIQLPVAMRATPTVTCSAAIVCANGSAHYPGASTTIYYGNSSWGTLVTDGFAGLTTNAAYIGSTSSGSFLLNAEL